MDKWQVILRENEALIHTRRWKGTGNYTLEYFIAQHRNAYVTITHAAEHVPYQLPNEATRVRYLLEGIETQDAQLMAAIESVRGDTGEGGKANNFESAAAHLQPRCPVTRRQSLRKRPASVADVTANVSETISAPSIGKTGVHLRWHKYNEYKALNKEQQAELYEWQQNNPDAVAKSKEATSTPRNTQPQKKRKKNQSLSRKSVSKIVAKEVA